MAFLFASFIEAYLYKVLFKKVPYWLEYVRIFDHSRASKLRLIQRIWSEYDHMSYDQRIGVENSIFTLLQTTIYPRAVRVVCFNGFSPASLRQHIKKSKLVRCLSVVRPSVALIISEHNLNVYGFLSNFSCCCPWTIWPDVFFLILKKKKKSKFFQVFFSVFYCVEFSSEWPQTLLRLQVAAELLLNFFLNDPHKTTCFFFIWVAANLPLHHMGMPNTSILCKKRTAGRNGVKFRTRR